MRSLFYELWQDKVRTSLTILSVFGGTLVVMMMLTFGHALKQALLKDMMSGGANIIRIKAGATTVNYKGIAKGRSLELTDQDVKSIEALPFLHHIQGLYKGMVSFGIPGKKIETRIIEGVRSSYFSLKNIQVGEGRSLSRADNDQRRRVIVVGYKIAEEMFKGSNPIGRNVLVNGFSFRVIGVTVKNFRLADFDGRDAYTSWIPERTYKGMFHPSSYHFLIGSVGNILSEKTIEDIIQKMVARHHHVSLKDNGIISVDDRAVMQNNVKAFMTGFEVFLGLIGATTLGLAGLSVATVVFLSVRENYKYIGVQMALGATPALILRRYIFEGVVTTFIGGFLGIGVGALMLWGLSVFLKHGHKTYSFFSKINFILSPTVFIVIMIILLIVSLIASIFPAYKASSILPAEALRYE